jgi:hypothetical protein
MDPAPTPDTLQFDTADVGDAGAGPLACHACQRGLHDVYFEVGGQPACERCRYELEDWRSRGSAAGRFARALVGGGLAGLVGAGLYYAVLALTGYEVGLVAIVVGFLVGFGVRWGSRGRGGWPYQLLAVGITYVAIVSTYVPFLIEEIQNMESTEAAAEEAPGVTAPATLETPVAATAASLDPAPATSLPSSDAGVPGEEITAGEALIGLAALAFLVLAIPFLGGFENILGLLIIGFGLYQAWKINVATPLLIEGPFQVGQRAPATTTSGPLSIT